MPSSENLFTLDPLKTSLTKTTTDVKVQGPANRTVENSQLLKGVQTFSNAVGSLAEVKKQEQITSDMRLAQNAAIRGEAEPTGLFGVASDEFERVVEANVITKTIRDMNTFIDGEGGAALVNAPGPLSANNAEADKFFDTIYNQGKNFSLNPKMLDIFNQKIEEQRNKTKLEIALVNRDRNRSQVSQRVLNMLEEVVDASKDKFSGGVETDASDIEGTEEYPILFALQDAMSPKFRDTVARDIVSLNMGIDDLESKRLATQLFLQNETVIAQPSLADKLMSSEYSPGVTYEALYSKGLLASNTDKDAADIVKMRNAQIKASNDHFKNLDDQDEDDAKQRTARGKEAVANSLKGGGSNEDAYGTGVQFGLAIQDVTKLITAQENFEGNVKLGLDSPQGISLRNQIANGGVTPEDIAIAIHEQNLDPGDEEFYKVLASKEKTQAQAAQKSYDSQIKIVKSNTLQLLKGALNNNSAKVTKDADGNFDFTALISQTMGGSMGLDSDELQDVMVRLQTLQNDYEYRSNEAAREVARSDTFDRAAVTKFGDDYNNAVALFISDLKKNIISSSAAKKERKKEEADKAAADKAVKDAKVEAETKDKVVPSLPPPPSTKQQIENHRAILTETSTHIKSEIDIVTNAFKSLFAKSPTKSTEEAKQETVITGPISDSEATYLKSIQAGIAEKEESTAPVKARDSKSTEPKSRTGLGPVADAIDAGFDKIGDIVRERVLQKAFQSFFDAGASDIEEAFPKRDRAFEESAAKNLGFSEEQLVIGNATGEVTSEGRKLYFNNFGGKSSEYTVGVTDSKINNGELTHIPSIYNGKIVTEQEAVRIISENKGIDPETGRFITPGGDPEERSKSITFSKETPNETTSSTLSTDGANVGKAATPDNLKTITKKLSKEAGVNAKHINILHLLESSGGKNLTNPDSSAQGAGQIIDSTARTLAKRLDTTQDKVQGDTETNVKGTISLWKDSIKRYTGTTDDPIIFAYADQHGGRPRIKAAMDKADNPGDIESVIEQLLISGHTDTVNFIRKAQKELNK